MRPLTHLLALIFLIPAAAYAASPSRSEMDLAARWAAAKLEGRTLQPLPQPGLVVERNHDPVQKNARGGKPMRLGKRQFSRGLYCHAPSRVLVRSLPARAKTFVATVGVDSNDQTSGGRGSVVFSIEVDGRQRFKSGLMRENTPPLGVKVDVDGAETIALQIDDGGDGISCDQGNWADARIVMADGSSVWLGDLPLLDADARRSISTDPFFSFAFGGKPSDLMAMDTPERRVRVIDDQRISHTLTWNDPASGLVVRCEAVVYQNFPTVEWTVFIRNEGQADSPLIEDLQAVDTIVHRRQEGEFLLHHSTGSPCLPTDYQPHETELPPQQRKHIATTGGRSTNSDMPFFNVEWPGEGCIVAMGWPGQWAAEFSRDSDTGLRIRGGQELTKFVLRPGEEVRTPLVVLQFYQGNATRAQNIWRSWMIAHNMPRPAGRSVEPMIGACSSHQAHEMIHATESHQIGFIDGYLDRGIKLDYWWMDAGWYVNNGDWPNVGTWEVDTKRFPRGLRAITDHARSRGVKSILWFEPERVTPGTKLYEKRDWLLGPDGQQKLLNLGDDRAREWLTDHISRTINEQGIDLYRSDFNIDPLPYWRGNDAPDRQGITEIRYVQGFLAFWDELRRRHPDMLIDTCASGGRRNDLETLRRAVPLLRSDYILEPVGQQNHTMGIARWIPYYGTGVNSDDEYVFRSQMCPWITGVYDVRRDDLDYAQIRRRVAEWREASAYYLGDYYPLTPYTTDNTAWVAWQFHDEAAGAGVVQAFRRAESIYEAAALKLQGLEPATRYAIKDHDSGIVRELSGAELAAGFSVSLRQQPGAALLTYKRIDERK